MSSTYPGRASVAPILDVFATLLHLGADGWKQKLESRQKLFPSFKERLEKLAASHGERVLSTPNNGISMAVTLTSGGGDRAPTAMGAALWVRLISGCRICAPVDKPKEVAGIEFINYGAHHDAYPCAYFTVACALGIVEEDVLLFLKRLDKTLTEWKKPPHAPKKSLSAVSDETAYNTAARTSGDVAAGVAASAVQLA